MKKVLIGILALIMVLGLVGCSYTPATEETDTAEPTETTPITEEIKEPEKIYSLGDTAETDILKFTLDRAELAICLHDGTAGDFDEIYLPKEYDASTEDFCIAAKGHTLVAYTYIVENLDRGALEFDFDTTTPEPFISIQYGRETYDCVAEIKAYSYDGFEWNSLMSTCTRLEPTEKMQIRTFVDIPVEASSLEDDFTLIFKLPSSSGNAQVFSFAITKEDIDARDEQTIQEISLEEAIANFNNDKAKEYFEKHMGEYVPLTGEEIKEIITNNEWNIGGLFTKGNIIAFDDKGNSIDSYGTERKGEIVDNMLDLKLASKDDTAYEVRKINDNAYLLISNDKPYCVFYK